jgi:hypothetical protein
MNTKIRLFSITVIGFLLNGEQALVSAQMPYTPYTGVGGLPQNRPVYSPYLNLLRRNNSTLQNYFGLVRPELGAINGFNAVQSQFASQNQTINEAISGALPDTGRQVSFMNYGGYFGNIQGGRGSSFLQVGGGLQSVSFGGNSFSSGLGGGGPSPTPRGPRR